MSKDTAQLELTDGTQYAEDGDCVGPIRTKPPAADSVEDALCLDTRYGLIRAALLDSACDPEKLRAMLDVQKDWEANEQRKAFCADLVKFQSECKIIAPLDQGDKNKYAKLDRIWRETRELRAECGLSVAWQVCRIDAECKTCELAGLLVHRDGHTLDIARTMPVPEEIVSSAGKRVQNATQRAGSAESYCKRYAVLAVLGVVIGIDDDGAGGATEQLTPAQEKEIGTLLEKLPERRRQKFFDVYDVDHVSKLSKAAAIVALLDLRKAVRTSA